ncbi:MAG TPA: helicase-associated domain-containing protein, partial [Isosphaeraceae bacterium]|nr:helicase-associated domain-containing protein [Isosphaeraceae bacterium]
MSYGSYWGRATKRETRRFFERAYQRTNLAAWDARWHALTAQARLFFLEVVKGPAKQRTPYSQPPSVSAARFPPHVLEELTAAGFVEVQAAGSRAFTDRVIARDELYDFAARVRTARRLHLLAADQPSELSRYVDHVFFGGPLAEALFGVLRKAGITDVARLEDVLKHYVLNHRWPGWVARALNAPLAERILDVVRKAEGPLPLVELLNRIEGSKPDEVRSVVDQLVAHLVLVEDLHPETRDIMIGFLPAVREGLTRASQPRERPPLLVCERPKEIGPDGSVIVNDLRGVLLEVASEPPQLRQDKALFQKEFERFQAALEPLAAWLLNALKWSDESRLSQALAWARALELVKEVAEGKQTRLHLTPKGHRWLASDLDEQYSRIYDRLRSPPARHDVYSPHHGLFLAGLDPFSNLGPGDMRFLGEHVTVLRAGKGTRSRYYFDAKPEDYQALRTHLDRALAQLKPGVFYRLDRVEAHLVFGEHNPLNTGLAPDQVAVFLGHRPVPALEEQREEAGQYVLDAFVRRRLIPLGCVRAAIDDQGRLCIARSRRLDAYFGREVAEADLAPSADVTARVVVQPDFSVIVIGPNPAPAAELAPFCERTGRGASQGAVVLKITRESVVKAVSHGLKPAEIAARLRRHASNEVPANVLREVQDWSNWVRQVTAATMTVLRCPDRDAADRVMAVLKRQAERVNETLVA